MAGLTRSARELHALRSQNALARGAAYHSLHSWHLLRRFARFPLFSRARFAPTTRGPTLFFCSSLAPLVSRSRYASALRMVCYGKPCRQHLNLNPFYALLVCVVQHHLIGNVMVLAYNTQLCMPLSLLTGSLVPLNNI